MKNINSVLSSGSATQRALIYFENLALESVKEATNVSGFLSNYEKEMLYHSFTSQPEMTLFNRFNKAYGNVIYALNKLLILRLSFDLAAESYYWMKATQIAQNTALEAVNWKFYEEAKNIKDLTGIKEFVGEIPFGKLFREDGFYYVKQQKELDICSRLPVLKDIATDKLTKVKSAIHATRLYTEEEGFNITEFEKWIDSLEFEVVTECSAISTKYEEVEIDEKYSKWFVDYFLK